MIRIAPVRPASDASSWPSVRLAVKAAPIVLPMRSAPAAARLALPPARRERGSEGCSMRSILRRRLSTISVACARSRRYISSMAAPKRSSSTITSSSQLPSQLAAFRFVEPTRAQWPSATAVLACIIGPLHSNTRTPASSRGR